MVFRKTIVETIIYNIIFFEVVVPYLSNNVTNLANNFVEQMHKIIYITVESISCNWLLKKLLHLHILDNDFLLICYFLWCVPKNVYISLFVRLVWAKVYFPLFKPFSNKVYFNCLFVYQAVLRVNDIFLFQTNNEK